MGEPSDTSDGWKLALAARPCALLWSSLGRGAGPVLQQMRLTFAAAALLVLVGTASAATGQQTLIVNSNAVAGFNFGITQSGAQKFLDILIPLINSKFQAVKLPDVHIEEKVAVIGKIKLDVTDLWIESFRINGAHATTAAPNLFKFSVNGLSMSIKCNWRWRKSSWPHVSDHGNAKITPEKGDMSAAVSLAPDASKHLKATCTSSSCNFDKFKIKFGGHWDSWLYNLFTSLFSRSIKKTVDQAVAAQLKSIIDTSLNAALQQIPTEISFGGGDSRMIADVGFVQTQATNTYIAGGLPFSIRNNKTGQACPLVPDPIPVFDTSMAGRHMELILGATPLSCALWVPFVNGALKFAVPDNTKNWAIWVPALPKLHPNMGMVNQYVVNALPLLKMTAASGFAGIIPMHMVANVQLPDKSLKQAFVLGTTATVALDARVSKGADNWLLYLNVTALKVDLNVMSSEIGPIDVSLLQGFLSICTSVIRGAIDLVLKNGFPLPVGQGLALVNPNIHIGDNFLEVGADIGFNPLLVQDPEGFLRGDYESGPLSVPAKPMPEYAVPY